MAVMTGFWWLQIKRYMCVVCMTKEIYEYRIANSLEGEVPDINNCDFNTYSDKKITGGRLLKNRPNMDWNNLFPIHQKSIEEMIKSHTRFGPYHFGGVCDDCLNTREIKPLCEGGHINFESPAK